MVYIQGFQTFLTSTDSVYLHSERRPVLQFSWRNLSSLMRTLRHTIPPLDPWSSILNWHYDTIINLDRTSSLIYNFHTFVQCLSLIGLTYQSTPTYPGWSTFILHPLYLQSMDPSCRPSRECRPLMTRETIILSIKGQSIKPWMESQFTGFNPNILCFIHKLRRNLFTWGGI